MTNEKHETKQPSSEQYKNFVHDLDWVFQEDKKKIDAAKQSISDYTKGDIADTIGENEVLPSHNSYGDKELVDLIYAIFPQVQARVEGAGSNPDAPVVIGLPEGVSLNDSAYVLEVMAKGFDVSLTGKLVTGEEVTLSPDITAQQALELASHAGTSQ